MEFHTEGARLSDAHDTLVHCFAGIHNHRQQWNEWMAASAESVRCRDNNSRQSYLGLTKMMLVHPDKDKASVFVHPYVTLPCQTFQAISSVSQGSVAAVRR